jgi:thioredoxin 1
MGLKDLETKEEFDQGVSDGVLVWLSAPWCGPCKQIAPVIKEIAEGRDVLKVNIDEFPGIAEHYKVMSIPTLIDFRDSAIKVEVGAKPRALLLKEFAV